MAYSSFTDGNGTPNNLPWNGYRPPYKIGDYFTMPDITGREAPGFSGNDAKPMLIRGLSIAVGGRSTSSATSQFGVWTSGANGYFSSTFTLPNAGTGYPSKLYKDLTSPKPVIANNTYLLGFLKRNTQLITWSQKTGVSGSTRRDNTYSADSSNFSVDATNTSSASLSWTVYYDVLPPAPNSSAASATGSTINLSWASPTLVSGEAAITGYRIQRSTDNATWTTIVANTGAGVTSYADTSLAWSTTYYYRIAAHNQVSFTFGDAYSGPYASSVSATTGTQPLPPNPPAAGKAISLLDVTVANPNPTSVEFSDDSADGIPYEDIQVVYGSEYLYNRITANSRLRSEATDPPVTVDATTGHDGSSQATYGVRGYEIGTNLLNNTDADLTTIANRLLYKTYKPNLRVESITVRINKLDDDQLESVLNIDIDSPVTIYFTPNSIGNRITTSGRVIGISHQVDVETHTVTFRLQSMDSSPFVLNTQAFGVLDVNVLG